MTQVGRAGAEPMLCTIDEAIHTLSVNLAALASQGTKRVDLAETS